MPDDHGRAAGVHGREGVVSSLRAAILITLLIFAVEVAGGYLSGSLSLVSDAVHMLGDLFALLLSLAAVLLARQLPTRARTYGYHRAEVLAAFVNGLVLVAVTAGILLSAAERGFARRRRSRAPSCSASPPSASVRTSS